SAAGCKRMSLCGWPSLYGEVRQEICRGGLPNVSGAGAAQRSGRRPGLGQPALVPRQLSSVTGRVTPCAPFLGRSVNRGAHGVTRPTVAVGGVTKFICRCTSQR